METLDDKMEASKAKARALLRDGKRVGWDLKEFRELKKQQRFELDLWNEVTGETVEVAWEAGVWQTHPARYTYNGRIIRLKNASAARKRMAQPPDIVAPRRGRSMDGGGRSEGAGRIIAKSVPFDPENTNEEELRRLLAGKKIVWLNSQDPRIIEEAFVPNARAKTDRRSAAPPGGKLFKISNGTAGRPIISFADPHTTGFRHVALEAILQVK